MYKSNKSNKKNIVPKNFKPDAYIKTDMPLKKDQPFMVRLPHPIATMVEDLSIRTERSAQQVIELILRYHLTTDPLYELPHPNDKWKELWDKGHFRLYIATIKDRLDHLPHEHEVVTKKEYEKAQYSTLEQDQLIRFEEEEL